MNRPALTERTERRIKGNIMVENYDFAPQPESERNIEVKNSIANLMMNTNFNKSHAHRSRYINPEEIIENDSSRSIIRETTWQKYGWLIIYIFIETGIIALWALFTQLSPNIILNNPFVSIIEYRKQPLRNL